LKLFREKTDQIFNCLIGIGEVVVIGTGDKVNRGRARDGIKIESNPTPRRLRESRLLAIGAVVEAPDHPFGVSSMQDFAADNERIPHAAAKPCKEFPNNFSPLTADRAAPVVCIMQGP
jgi:hypothetical protein